MKRLLLLFFVIISTYSLYAQAETRGTDFWVSFANNNDQSPNSSVPPLLLQIRIVANDAATGTITFTGITGAGKIVPFAVAANSVLTYTLSTAEMNAAYNLNAGTSDKTVRIQSNVPVTVYAFNTVQALAEATSILPTPILGNNYYHLGRIPASIYHSDQYMVISTQNNTVVYENGVQVATLQAGEVYLRKYAGTDMSGYHITSNNPIAYFSANDYCAINGGGDNLFTQLPPVNTWGKNFIVPVTTRTVELIRIIASQNNTTITQTGGTIMPVAGGNTSLTLNAGEWVELQISLANAGCYIQADKPVMVCSYMVGSGYTGAVNPGNFGDESMCLIPPIEQTIKSALIAPFANNTLTVHYGLIVTPTATKNNTTIQIGSGAAQPLSGGTWYDNAASGMSFYSVQFSNSSSDAYLIKNQNGLIVFGYGFGYYISYYYLAASSMRNLEAAFYVNNVHYQDLSHEIICSQPLQFRAEVQGDLSSLPGRLKWYIDNVEETTVRDMLTWSKTIPAGTYQVKLTALMDDNITTKTVEGTMTVGSMTAPPISPSGIVSVCPPITSIQLSTVGDSCRWFKDGVAIPNVTSNTYTATTSGTYTVMILYKDCSTAMSNSAIVIFGCVTANDDIAYAFECGTALIDVLANDKFTGSPVPELVSPPSPLYGTALIVGNKIQYTDVAPCDGGKIDIFKYRIGINNLVYDTATVRVSILPVPKPLLKESCSFAPKLEASRQYAGAVYLWEYSADGTSGWTTVGTTAVIPFTETGFYRLTTTLNGIAAVGSAKIKVIKTTLKGGVWYETSIE